MIILGATPIGNLGDVSLRLRDALSKATVIAAEDTRVTAHLLRALEVDNRPRLIALHEHNETAVLATIVEHARDADVLVLSDAGMPTVSDPGFRLVAAAADAGVVVTVIPGPSAVLTALAVSGLPSDRYCFEGFLPRRARRSAILRLSTEERTLIFFESPNRLPAALVDLAEVFGGERRAVVCRELTKKHEEVARGTLSELANRYAEGTRGEIVLVVAGASAPLASMTEALARLGELTSAGTGLKEASVRVAEETGISRRQIYQEALAKRGKQ